MADLVTVLKEFISLVGRENNIIPSVLENFLRENYATNESWEIEVLVFALQDGVVEQLISREVDESLKAKLIADLSEVFDKNIARWCVETWGQVVSSKTVVELSTKFELEPAEGGLGLEWTETVGDTLNSKSVSFAPKVERKSELKHLYSHDNESEILSLAFNPDGKSVVSSSIDNKLICYRLDEHDLHILSESMPAYCIAFRNSREMIIGSEDTITIFDNGSEKSTFTVHRGKVTGVEFISSINYVVTAGQDGLINFYSETIKPRFTKPRFTRNCESSINVMVFDSNNSSCFVAYNNVIEKRSVLQRNGKAILGEHSGTISTLSIVPNRNLLISGGTDRLLAIWDIELKRKEVYQLIEFKINIIAYNNAHQLIAVGTEAGGIELRRLKDLEIVMQHDNDCSITALKFHPREDYLIYGDKRGNVYKLWF